VALLLAGVIAHHVFWHISEATFGVIIVAMIGAISVRQGRRGRRVEAKVDQGLEQTSTGNGKNIGETVHDIAQLQEVLSAQVHTNTRELLVVSTKADKAAAKATLAAAKADLAAAKAEQLERIVNESSERLESKLDQHLTDSSGKFEEIITKLDEGAA